MLKEMFTDYIEMFHDDKFMFFLITFCLFCIIVLVACLVVIIACAITGNLGTVDNTHIRGVYFVNNIPFFY